MLASCLPLPSSLWGCREGPYERVKDQKWERERRNGFRGYALDALQGAFPGSLSEGFVRRTTLEHYALYMWGFFVLHLLQWPAHR